MSPDQRKMMEDMLANPGVGMSVGNRGMVMKMSFVCTKPPSSGEGKLTIESPQAYASQTVVTGTVAGKPEQMSMDSRGKWLSGDCGNVQPIRRPKS